MRRPAEGSEKRAAGHPTGRSADRPPEAPAERRTGRPSGEDGDNQAPFIAEIMGLFGMLQERWTAEDDEERRWMAERAGSDAALAKLVKQMTVAMLHVIEAIGHLEPVNGITVAKESGIARGTVSKVARRLAEMGVIRAETLPDNKKEIRFRLTETGRSIHRLHAELHLRMLRGSERFLRRYSPEELQFFVRVLRDAIGTSWVYFDEQEQEADR